MAGETPKLTYEEREKFACEVCGNVPDEHGVIEHGRGCYTQSSDGGGVSFVEFARHTSIESSLKNWGLADGD